ncbi:MAG: S4 domain-containing protein, partial [Pygmaiobacter sp.]
LMTLHAPLLCDELKTVGRVTVSLQLCDTLPQELTAGQGAEQSLNVASLRLDAVLAAVLHTARGQADEVIRSGKVQVNHRTELSASFTLSEDDSLTVRGVGKFRFKSVDGTSKKGRLFITIIQY